jgi:hypothetical protein
MQTPHDTNEDEGAATAPASPCVLTSEALTLDALWAEAREIFKEVLKLCGSPQDLAQLVAVRTAEHAKLSDMVHESERLVRRIVILLAAQKAHDLPPVKPRETPPLSPASPAHARAHEREMVQTRDAHLHPQQHGAAVREPRPRATFPGLPCAILAETPAEEWRVSFRILRNSAPPQRDRISARTRHNRHWRARKARLEAAGVRKPYIPPYQPKRTMMTGRLAMRVEAMRRVISNPDPFIHRTARRMQRLRAANRTLNLPIRFIASSEPPRRKNSLGWLHCGPAIRALNRPACEALKFLDTG